MSDINRKLDRIKLISVADEGSINFLLNCLDDLELLVRAAAYECLKSLIIENNAVKEAIDRGVLLRPDDIVYSVYKSGLSYTDDSYIIHDYTDSSDKNIYGEKDLDTHDNLWSKDVPRQLISTCISRELAENQAKEFMKSLISNQESYHLFHYYPNKENEISQQDIFDWASQYQLADLPKPINPNAFQRIEWITWDSEEYPEYSLNLGSYCQQLQSYAVDILEHLTIDAHYDLIEKIYTQVVGRLAYVQPEEIAENTYLWAKKC
jgi:hypothetical protein